MHRTLLLGASLALLGAGTGWAQMPAPPPGQGPAEQGAPAGVVAGPAQPGARAPVTLQLVPLPGGRTAVIANRGDGGAALDRALRIAAAEPAEPSGPDAGGPPGGPPPGGPMRMREMMRMHEMMMHQRPDWGWRMPPSKAAHFHFSRGDNSIDIKCADDESTQACVQAASTLLDKLAAMHQAEAGGSAAPGPAK